MQIKKRLEVIMTASVIVFAFSAFANAGTNEGISAIQVGDCETALKELLPAAENGDIKAQTTLGGIYTEGNSRCEDFQSDPGQAARWYLRAAELGDPEAQHAIASIYHYGQGVPVDLPSTFKWLRKSAVHGNSGDLRELSGFYEKGEGIPVDRVLAYTFRALAEKMTAQSDTAHSNEYLSYYAENMSPDQLAEAKRLTAQWKREMPIPDTSKTGRLLPSAFYRKDAEAGNAQALYKLGMIYRNNLEGTGDDKKALIYLRAAAEKGHTKALETLAQIYKCGQCGPVDYVLSYMMSELAVRDKGAKGKAQVGEMWDDVLLPEQRAEAKTLISHWKPGAALPIKTKTGHLRKVNYAEPGKEKLKATPDVIRLFSAANEGDEKTFNQLIDTIQNINDYVVNGDMLLHALILPAKSLRDNEYKWQHENNNISTEAHMLAQRKIYLATLLAKTRMLALALQHGASVNEGTDRNHESPLHLATLYGSPEMVAMLLQHGADANQYGGENYSRQPIEFSLELADRKLTDRNISLHEYELVTPEQRTEIIIALLRAGAKMPYSAIDKLTQKETKKTPERPAADYLLWNGLVSLTVGSEVLTLMEKTGTTPAFDANNKSVLAYAAQAGNLDGVRWLKSRLPKSKDFENSLLDAAMWGIYSKPSAVDAILNELVVEGMAWGRAGPERDEDANKYYRLLNLPRMSETSTTLLGHAVRTRQYEWVSKIVKLGAPVDGVTGYNDTPLTQAVAIGDTKMIKLLLALGANPVAGDEQSPLMRAVEPSTKNPNKIEIMTTLLNKVIQDQKSFPDAIALKLVDHVLKQRESDDIANAVIKTLVAAGFSPNKLSPHNIAYVMQLKDRGLIDYLIEHGALKSEKNGALPETYSILLNVALWTNREDLLPTFFAAGLSPNTRPDDSDYTSLEYAIKEGYVTAVETFIQKFGIPVDSKQHEWGTVLDLAIASGHKEIVNNVADRLKVRLEYVCMPNTKMLVETVLERTENYWSFLVQHGFASKAGACDNMLDRLLTEISNESDMPQVGWIGQQLSQRLKDMSGNGIRLNELVSAETIDRLNERGRQDVVLSLEAAGWQPPKLSVPEQPARQALISTPHDIALSRQLAGHYYLAHVTEVGSELVLFDDGRFNYALSYGATDEFAVGTWQVINGSVIFRSHTAPAHDPYQLIDAQPLTGSNAVVSLVYKKRTIPGVSITLLGERGMKAAGLTTEKGFVASLSGPIKQIVIFHREVNNGRAFVYNVSDTDTAKSIRKYVFEIKPIKSNSTGFNVEMAVKDGQLVLNAGGRDLRYEKQN